MNPSIFSGDAQSAGAGKPMPASKTRGVAQVLDTSIALPRNAGTLQTEVEQMRQSTGTPLATSLRRLLFVWFRVYVRTSKRGKEERVNVGIPIPIPVVGALLRQHLDFAQALKVVGLAHQDPQAAGQYLESCMALELVRVETGNAERDKQELVVVGLD